MVQPIMMSPGTTGTDEPPGITAFSLRPFQIPPAISSKSLNGIPIGNSKLPGFATWPETENIIVPPELGTPKPANHAAPLRMMAGTEA
jgi:hypothetical protein